VSVALILAAALFAVACSTKSPRPDAVGPVPSAPSDSPSKTERTNVRTPGSEEPAPTVSPSKTERTNVRTAGSDGRGGEFVGPALGSSRCGNVDCRIFGSPAEAFRTVLGENPRVLGIGETHALRGSEAVEPATRRFTRDLLPLLAGRTSDLVVELLLPNAACHAETKAAKETQRVVTEHQAPTDQNDYVALGTAAKALGIRPHALEPTCDDLAHIGKGGADAIATSLDVIARLSRELATRLLDANDAANDARGVVLYGGALHNDITPRPGREGWSYGPSLASKTSGRYVELDLIVPEFIGDSPAWRSFPWVPSFDPMAHPREAALLTPAVHGFVLVFPRTEQGGK
jgi:hypothetical protein